MKRDCPTFRCGSPATSRRVFADATYQYVRKGQPLFTIYSPDLVATEREYLVAKQNQQQVAQSTVPGVVIQRSILARRGDGATETVGCSTAGNR